MSDATPLYIIGDIHGQYQKLLGLLSRAGLIAGDLAWSGGMARLWFMGDLFDRGPDAIAVVDLIMRLQIEARAAGGQVASLLGNHEPLILAALHFGNRAAAWGGTFLDDWRRNGGHDQDLDRLTPERVAWLSQLPAIARVGDLLLMHADAPLYSSYGATVEAVNLAFSELIQSRVMANWDRLLEQFSDRMAFADRDPDGAARAGQLLADFGGQRIVHGHTPISYMLGRPDALIGAPLVYAGGRCVNVDGGMYRGGPGFVYRHRAGE